MRMRDGALSAAMDAGKSGKTLVLAAARNWAAKKAAEEAEAARVYGAEMVAAAAERQYQAAAATRESAQAPAAGPITPAPAAGPHGDYESYIYQVAGGYAPDMVRVMYCESSGNARADNGLCRGLFQYQMSTWLSTPEGAAGASIWDGYAQIRMTVWMWSQGRKSEWECR